MNERMIPLATPKGLGRGLGALLGDFQEPSLENSNFRMVPLHRIEPNPDQPRKDFDEEALQELAESISAHGLIQPLTVRETNPGYYQIIAGERRWRAWARFPWWSSRPTTARPWSWLSLKICSAAT